MPSTLLVVPCYNEARRLDVAAFERFAQSQPDVDLLFVDDGSRDATPVVLARLAACHPRQMHVLQLATNGGKAEAVRQGTLAGLALAPQYIGYWDADLAAPLDELPAFRAVLQRRPEADIVIGSRLPLSGRRIERSRFRAWLGRAFARAASCVLGLRLLDTQCGAKLLRVGPATAALFERPFRSRWIFDVELLARIAAPHRSAGKGALRAAIYELPLDSWREVGGSRLKAADYSRALWELAAIFRTLPRAAADTPRAAAAGRVGSLEAPAGARRAA